MKGKEIDIKPGGNMFDLSGVFLHGAPCPPYNLEFFLFLYLSRNCERDSQRAICFDLSGVLLQDGVMAALNLRKVENFLEKR